MLGYIAGYAFVLLIPNVPISNLLERIWQRVPRTLYPPAPVDLPWKGLMLGTLERVLYVTALLLMGEGGLTFIAALLALKVAGNWDYWKSARTGKLFDLHLAGILLSLVYAAVAWQVIVWTTSATCLNSLWPPCLVERLELWVGGTWTALLLSVVPSVLLALVLVGATVVLCKWLGRRDDMPAQLEVIFVDGTQHVFEMTGDVVRELEEQQRQGRELYTFIAGEQHVTIRASQIRAWSATTRSKT
jgi:hypothetical protein